MSHHLTPTTLYKAVPGSQISKLVPIGHSVIIGEERNVETRTCTLFAVDLNEQRELWSNTKIDIDWWFTIQDATPDLIILQAYEESPLPQVAGIYALEATSGRLLWMLPMLEHMSTRNGSVYALRRSILRSEYLKIDPSTGNILEIVQESDLPHVEPTHHDLSFPVIVNPEHITSSELETMLGPIVHIPDIRGMIEEFVQGDTLIVSYYSRETKDAQSMLENRLKQELLIVERPTGQVLLHERLQSSANYPVTGSYFLTNNLLIYVKESNELATLDLS